VHPEDLERVRNLHTDPGQRLEKTMAEYRLRRADGRYRWFLESTVPRCHADGGFAGEVGCAFDITERHQVEQLLRGAKQRLESMVQQRTEQLSKANRVLEQRVLEQQALTRELQHTQAQLLQSEKMAGIGQLAAGVAHEINNPIGYIHSNLSVLKGYTEDLFELINTYAGLVNRLPLDDGLRQELEQTKGKLDLDFLRQDIPQLLGESLQGAEQARLIVQNLKDFTGVDRRQAAPFDLEAGLENTLEMLGRDIQADIRREFSHLQPVICVGAQINQVFQQLLDNALKAMEGPGTITVRTGREGSDWVWVEIQDSGRGIPEQHLGRLFDPFFTTRPVGEGTGMGLALAYTIVQQHGGRIDVHSSPGAGARFRLWLPDTAKMNAAPG
jgi:two-component system NtrC family sensor kinase